jgi:hypothetical protein
MSTIVVTTYSLAMLYLFCFIRYRIGEREDFNATPWIQDTFAGYRYEKPHDRLLIRADLSIPLIVIIGIGFKF